MRTLRLLTVAALLAPAVGCNWMKEWREQARVRPTGKIEPVTPGQLVTYLNDRASRLQSIEYGNTRMRVSGKGIPLPATLDGNLAAAGPRSFRMISDGRIAASKVDMGSNDELFWVYLQVPNEKPVYVYATHDDFRDGRAKLPMDIPFEPEWVMQALGMTTFPDANQYDVRINERDRTYSLVWDATTPGGTQVVKEVVFDADAATGTRPQVKRHVIRDKKSNGVIASAEIKSAGTIAGTADQYPTHVVLRWEQQKVEMDLVLERAMVNQAFGNDPTRSALFTRPEIRGATAIDLAKYEFVPQK